MVKKMAFILCIFLLCATPAMADKSIRRNVKSIDIEGLSLSVYKQESENFFVLCESKKLDAAIGTGTIDIGDTIEFDEGSIHVSIIEYIKYTEQQTVHLGGVELDREWGDTDCIVISDEYNYPSDDRCLNIWMLVEGCRLAKP